jgi:Protein of unknown function (DUF1574)
MPKLLKIILFLLPIPAVVFVTTWMVDPANIKDDDSFEAGVASILLSGKNAANLVNYNERKLQKYIILGLPKPPEVIVLGSSRSMGISSGFFPNKVLLNNSVSGASIEDYIGIFDLYRIRGLKPKLVIIGLDPWILNRNNGQDRWKYLNDEYFEMKYILGFHAPDSTSIQENLLNKIRKYKEFLSPAYFQQSCIYLIQKGRTGKKYWATDKLQAEEPIKIADGSYVYGEKFREKKVTDVNSDARVYAMAKPMYSLGGFNELDQSKMQLLDSFIDYLKKNEIRVLIYLPPYHPMVFEVIKTNKAYAMVAESEKWYRFLANKHTIKIVGSYDPKISNLEESDFFDGMHPNNQAAQRIFFLCGPEGNRTKLCAN